ncbi:YaaA family protein [Helicobacter typhlonius]|uniref:YaaA family protein n=1 Tax=Helicobacter typhlonius TaxID=76936 RepID=UPI000EB90451|nr:peroxide stress protein YaaA [Helicobacter sp.]
MSIKILFSPSEGKNKPQNTTKTSHNALSHILDSQAVREYVTFLQTASERDISAIFGSKILDMHDLALSQNLFASPKIEAIRLYSGVGYKALDFESLDFKAQSYVRENLYIFSNLFGAVRADTLLPYYNLHQGKGVGAFSLKNLYKDLKAKIDKILCGEEVLDLRAEAYIKAYKCECARQYYQIVFLKNGKKVSHYAKFYRGLYARSLAQKNIKSLENLENLRFDFINLSDVVITQNATILTYEIIS